MPQVLAAVFALFVAFFVLWVIFALIVRVISFALFYWGATLLLGGLVGMGTGVVLPARLLLGHGKAPLRQITPADLMAGKVIARKPAGPNREFGWDPAWPNYIPYQAVPDAQAVAQEVALHLKNAWAQLPIGREATTVFWFLVSLPALVGYTLGVCLSTLGWYVVMGVLGLAIVGLQQLGLGWLRLTDVMGRKRRRESLKCPHPGCYGESSLPGYRCSGPGCTNVHWSMLPGALGLFTRRCACGVRLPNTVSSAARQLRPVCPYCKRSLAEGSGGRQTITIAIMGSIGAGKTRLVDAATVAYQEVLAKTGGKLSPLDERGTAYLHQARERIARKAQTAKTQHQQPTGLLFLLRHNSAVVELQLFDAAGEAFANWDETAKLRYLDQAGSKVFVLDPLALPRVNEQLRRSGLSGTTLVAAGDQEEAYAAAVDRMRAEAVPVGQQRLAVVLTKGDVLMKLPIASSLKGHDTDSIRAWLVENGSDLLVRRFEKDFGSIQYFVVDSMSQRDPADPMNPWWTFEWLLGESATPIRLADSAVLAQKP
jgi:hypothetical protein